MKPVDSRILLLKLILKNKEHLFGQSNNAKISKVICRLDLNKRELINYTSIIDRSMGRCCNICETASFINRGAGLEIFAGYNMAKLAQAGGCKYIVFNWCDFQPELLNDAR